MRILMRNSPTDLVQGGGSTVGSDVIDGSAVDDTVLAQLYAAEPADDGVWLRVNMVSTLDGAAQGDDGVSDSINNEPDKRAFRALRSYADVIVVGAGTVRAEGYRPTDKPMVVLSRSGEVPESLRGATPGQVLMATVEQAPALEEARALLGSDNVLVLGAYAIDFALLRTALVARGWSQVLGEGGPFALHDMLASGAVDELCLTIVPRLIAGEHKRITSGPPIDVPLDPLLLLEEDGTLLGRWTVRKAGPRVGL